MVRFHRRSVSAFASSERPIRETLDPCSSIPAPPCSPHRRAGVVGSSPAIMGCRSGEPAVSSAAWIAVWIRAMRSSRAGSGGGSVSSASCHTSAVSSAWMASGERDLDGSLAEVVLGDLLDTISRTPGRSAWSSFRATARAESRQGMRPVHRLRRDGGRHLPRAMRSAMGMDHSSRASILRWSAETPRLMRGFLARRGGDIEQAPETSGKRMHPAEGAHR